MRLTFIKRIRRGREEAEFLNARGCNELLCGRPRAALVCFKKADKIHPNSSAFLLARALVYYRIGQGGAAIDLLDRAVQHDALNGRLYHVRGLSRALFTESFEMLFAAIKDLKHAKTLTEDAREKAGIEWDLGRTFFALSLQTGEAIELAQSTEIFESIEHFFLDNTRFYMDFYVVQMALSAKICSERAAQSALKHLRAIQNIEKSVELDLPFARAYKRLFELCHQMTYFNLSNTHFAQAQLKEPKEASIPYAWGRLLKCASLVQHDPIFLQVALKKFESAHALEPAHPKYALAVVKAIAYLSLFTDSIHALPQAAEILAKFDTPAAKDPDFLYAEGLCATAIGYFHAAAEFFERAMSFFSAAIALRGAHHLYWHGAGICALGLANIEGFESNIEKAILCFEKASKFDPSPDYTIDLAFACLRAAQLQQSEECLQRSIALFEKVLAHTKKPRLEWLFHYASALRLQGEWETNPDLLHAAIEVFKKVEGDETFALFVHFELGMSYSLTGELLASPSDLQLALAHFDIVMRADREHDRAFCEAAVAQINLAHLSPEANELQYKKAEKKLVHAARLGSLHALYYLACLYSLSEMEERSLFYLNKAKDYNSLPPQQQLLDDPWLDHVRRSPEFKRLLEE